MDHHSRHHPTNDNDTAIPGSGSSAPTQPAQDDDDSELGNIEHKPPAVASPSKGSRERRTRFLPGTGSSHQLLQAKSAIGSSATARSTGYSADRAARRDKNKSRKNPVVAGGASYADELFVDDDDQPEANEEEEVEAAATTTTIEEKQSPIPRHDLLLQAKSRIRSLHHQEQQRLQQSPVRPTPSTNPTIVDDDNADQKKKIRDGNTHSNNAVITPTRRRSASLEEPVEWDKPLSSSDLFSFGDTSRRSQQTPPGLVEDSVCRNSRSFPSVDYNDGALTAVVVEDPPTLLPAVVVNIKARHRIIGASIICTLLVMAALVTALTLTARANRRPTIVVVDKSEWVSIVNSATLSGQVLTYPPPKINASVEERALAWLMDVDNDQVPMRRAVQHYAFVVLALAWNYTNNNAEWQLEAGFDECELNGITCDNIDEDDDGTCIAMELPSAMLKGSIPADIGLLTNLRELDLSRNFLSGTVPWEPMMRSMSHLEVLDLSDSYFTGPIPVPRNDSWPALKTFWLQWNSFNGTISSGFAHWPSLEDFDVSQNKIGGTLRSELGQMFTLRTFAVYSNKISGSIPTEFGGLSRLDYFDIEGNGRMNGTIPTELGQWTRMVDFYCHDNQISGSIPTELGQWTNLAIFQAEYNKLSGIIPTEVEQWPNMRNFYIDHNEISGPLPAGIGNWTFLEEIHLHNNRLSGAVPSGVASWAKLSVATFEDNNLTGSLEDLCAIAPSDAIVSADSCELTCSCCTSSSDDDDDGVPQPNCTSSPVSP
jgi:hypothetical protein